MKTTLLILALVVAILLKNEEVLAQTQKNRVIEKTTADKIFSFFTENESFTIEFPETTLLFLKYKQLDVGDQVVMIQTSLVDGTEILCAIDEDGILVSGSRGCNNGSFNEEIFFDFGGQKPRVGDPSTANEDAIRRYIEKAHNMLTLFYSTRALLYKT